MPFSSILLATLALVICVNGVTQSNVVCKDDLEWAFARNGDSPCRVAARVQGACNGNVWNVPPINSTTHYNVPGTGNTPINPCTCSWAAYNLLSACADCQGVDQAIQNWSMYKLACTTNISTGYFPPIIQLEDGTRIPFWAITNPDTWPNGHFDVVTARQIANEGRPDTIQGVQGEPKKSHSVVGPVVGGVIGGLAAISLAVAAAFFIKIRKRRQHHLAAASSYPDPLKHNRNFSDSSQSTGAGIGLAYARIQSPQSFATMQVNRPPISPTARTHSSTHSLSYFGSVNGSAALTPSPPPQPHLQPLPPLHNPQMNREDIIVPFTLRPITPSQDGISHISPSLADRKRPDGSIGFDLPSALPQAAQVDESPIGSTSGKPKVNPPAYTPYSGQGGGSSSQATRPPHNKTGSADTQHSWDSGRSGSTTRPGGGSISAIDHIVGQIGFNAVEAQNSGGRGGGTVPTGGDMRNQPIHSNAISTENITRHNLA